MNNLKKMTKVFIIALLISLTTGSCQDNYKDLDDGLYAEFQTSKGTMVAKLYYEKAPVTVANFVGLAEGNHPKLPDSIKGKPFYDGITFHRVMDKFMIQGGDPTATGSGSPGFKFGDEFNDQLRHNKPGILSMANSGFGTNGSQFFITEKETPFLDAFNADGSLKECDAPKAPYSRISCHAVFGELVKGLEVQDSISNVEVEKKTNKPLKDIVINKLNIIRKGANAKAFDAVKTFNEGEPKLLENYNALKEKQLNDLKEKSKVAAENFKNANKNLGEVFESQTGMIMIKTKNGNGIKPKPSDKVNIDCAGYLEDGKLFYTTWKDVAKKEGIYDENADKQGMYKPFDRKYNSSAGLIPGFREAFLKMKIGDKAKVFIPSYLGYGAKANGPIPANSNLIFDLELVNIKK